MACEARVSTEDCSVAFAEFGACTDHVRGAVHGLVPRFPNRIGDVVHIGGKRFTLQAPPRNLGLKPGFSLSVLRGEERHKIAKHIWIQESTIKNAGFGAFWAGTHDIRGSTVLGVYTGKIVGTDVTGDYVLEFEDADGTVRRVDARNRAHWTPFMNDPRDPLEDNVRFLSDGSIEASADIEPGDEIFTNYGEEYDWHE